MASPNNKLAFFLIFSLTLTQLSITHATPIFEVTPHRILKGWYPKTHIEIENSLGNGLQAKVHCKNNFGADKGEQVINDGQSYQFGFTPNFLINTEWKCDFRFSGGAVSTMIYGYARDWKRCFKHCRYSIAKDGVHAYSTDAKDDLLFPWEKPTSA